MAGWLDSQIFTLLERGLDGLGVRQKVLADNIANNDTPNFKRSDVNFEKFLQAALEAHQAAGQNGTANISDGLKLAPLSAFDFIEKDQSTTFRNDGNNVDIDTEMVRLAENTLHYNSLVSMLTSQLLLLRQVIQEK